MKSYSKPLIVGLIALVSVGFIGAGQAGKQGGRGFNVDRMAERLNLTEEQRTQIEEIVASTKPQMTELRDAMQENRKQFRELNQQETFDEAKVREIATSQGDLKTEMMVLRAGQQHEINAVLTEEQRAQKAEWRAKKDERRGKKGCRR